MADEIEQSEQLTRGHDVEGGVEKNAGSMSSLTQEIGISPRTETMIGAASSGTHTPRALSPKSSSEAHGIGPTPTISRSASVADDKRRASFVRGSNPYLAKIDSEELETRVKSGTSKSLESKPKLTLKLGIAVHGVRFPDGKTPLTAPTPRSAAPELPKLDEAEDHSVGGSSSTSNKEFRHRKFMKEQAAERMFGPVNRLYSLLFLAAALLFLAILVEYIFQ